MNSRVTSKKFFYWSFPLAILLVTQFFLYQFYLFIPLTVNNKQRLRVMRGTLVREVIKKSGLEPKAGNLLDVEGKILKIGEGKPPIITFKGKRISLDQKIKEGGDLRVRDGDDIKEKTLKKIVIIPPSIKQGGGEGAFIGFGDKGRPGKKIIVLGEISKKVVQVKVIATPRPKIITKRNYYTSKKVVALTFDDGPHPRYTPKILAILRKNKISATFFVVGQEAEKYPRLLSTIIASGSTLANHTYSHANIDKIPLSQALGELDRCDKIVYKTTKKHTRWFRPPGGFNNPNFTYAVLKKGYQIVLWNVDSEDWRKPPPQTLRARVLSQVRPGAVILFHDGGGNRNNTIAALPLIIADLKRQGYSFITLEKLTQL